MDWPDLFRSFAKTYFWTPKQSLHDMTFAQLYWVWFKAAGRAEHNPTAIRDKINRLRAAKGLPPMRPATP